VKDINKKERNLREIETKERRNEGLKDKKAMKRENEKEYGR
jgi:hypothetical protein